MKILIVEDEYSIAKDIEWNCHQLVGEKIVSLQIKQTLESAMEFILKNQIDLLLLDLNLSGKNGFDLLKVAVSGSFHTIIISAHTDQAIEAFRYGVLDFLPKPFEQDRLNKAFDRYFGQYKNENHSVKYLTVKKRNGHIVISVDDVLYFKAANYYSEVVLKNGGIEILDKSLDRLLQILPSQFFRTHRSYIVDSRQIESFTPIKKGSSRIILKSGETLPLSKGRYKELRDKIGA